MGSGPFRALVAAALLASAPAQAGQDDQTPPSPESPEVARPGADAARAIEQQLEEQRRAQRRLRDLEAAGAMEALPPGPETERRDDRR